MFYRALHYAAGLSGPSDVLEILVAYRAEIDVVNDEGCTPLFFATQSNNKFAACVLIGQGANVRQKNAQGNMWPEKYLIMYISENTQR